MGYPRLQMCGQLGSAPPPGGNCWREKGLTWWATGQSLKDGVVALFETQGSKFPCPKEMSCLQRGSRGSIHLSPG